MRERRRARGDGARAPDAPVAWLLAIVSAGSVLAIGAVHLPVLLAASALTLAAATLAVALRARAARRAPVPLPVAIALGLAGYTLLQAAPLPMGWLEGVAPVNADVWARALGPLGEEPPRFASLSLDPGASLVEALKWATYAGVFFAAAVVASHRGAELGVAVVFASALVAALTTLGHGLLGATKVFGLYQPRFAAAPWHIGPLLNPNNLAGYLNLGAVCGAGLLLMRKPILPRWAVGLGVATILAIGVTGASRGGVGVLPIGAAVFAALFWRREGRKEGGERAPALLRGGLAVALGGGVSLALLGGSGMTWLELSDRDVSKLELFRSVLPMIREHAIFGVGRGAFESVYPAYRVYAGHLVFTHAENFPLQWASEWGLPVALAALGGLAWSLRPRALGVRRSAVAIGAWTGALVLLVQNLGDLALEVPAIPIALALVLGSLAGDARRRGARAPEVAEEGPAPRLDGRAHAAVVAALGVALLAVAAIGGRHDIASDRAAVRAAQEASEASRAEPPRGALREALRAAMRRHPGEPYFPLVGALAAWQSGKESPMPWLQRALERSRKNGRAHLLLAEVLAGRGAQAQALLELRLAVEDDADLVTPAARMAVRWARSYEDLLRAVPEGAAGARVLGALAQQLSGRGQETLRLQCAREAVARDPEALAPRWAAADVLLGAIGQDLPPGICTGDLRTACAHEIEAHAKAIEAVDHAAHHPAELRARLLMHEGRAAQAEELLSDACTRVKDRLSCLRLRVQAASAMATDARLVAAVKDLTNAACATSAQCAEVTTWLGDLMAGRKEWGRAVTQYERALAAEPNEARWLKLGDAASKAGAFARAIEAFERVLAARGGDDPELRRRIDEERGRAVNRMIQR